MRKAKLCPRLDKFCRWTGMAVTVAACALVPARTASARAGRVAAAGRDTTRAAAFSISPSSLPLLEGQKALAFKVTGIDANTQWLGVCLGRVPTTEPATEPVWTPAGKASCSAPGEYQISLAGGLPQSQLVRACVMEKDSDPVVACQTGGTACKDWPIFPNPRFAGTLVEGRSTFDISFPSGPWRKTGEAVSVNVKLERAGEPFTPKNILLPMPPASQKLAVNVAHLQGPTETLRVGDKLVVSIPSPQGDVALGETTVAGRLIRRAETTLGTKTVRVVLDLPETPEGGTPPGVQLSLPEEAIHALTSDERKNQEANLSLARPRLACSGGAPHAATPNACGDGKLIVTVRTIDAKSKDTLALEEAVVAELIPKADIEQPVKEGGAKVAGTVTAGIGRVRVRLLPGDYRTTPAQDKTTEPVLEETTEPVLEETTEPVQDKTFKHTFARPLGEGEVVEACPVADGTSPIKAVASGCTQVNVEPVTLDFGRVTAAFSVGTLFTQSDPGASGLLDSVKPYVALRVDTLWFNRLSGLNECGQKSGWAFALQSFFDARLTEAGTIEGTDNGAGGLVSKRAGLFQGGGFLPILPHLGESTRWHDSGEDKVLFFAPLVKLGFQAIEGGYGRMYETEGAGDAATLKKDAEGKLVPSAGQHSVIAPFWAAGARFGFSQLRALSGKSRYERSRVPRPITYFDIVIGHFDNYREIDEKTGATKTHARLAAEGRLAVPGLPMEVGFDANLRLKHAEKIPHDYRVFLNVRFDAAAALRRMFGAPPS